MWNDRPGGTRSFAGLLQWAGELAGRGMLVPDDPVTLAAMFTSETPKVPAVWEAAGQAVHAAYVDMVYNHAIQLRPRLVHDARILLSLHASPLHNPPVSHQPTPLDTTGIVLPAERVAENTRET